MRILLFFVVLLLASCGGDRQVRLLEVGSESSVRFDGYGKQYYVPDAFDMRGAIVVRNVDVQEGAQQHRAIVAAVSDYLAQLEDINYRLTVGGLTTKVDWRGSNRKVEYYEFKTDVAIRCRNLDMMEQLQVDLIERGMDRFDEVSIFSENIHDITNLARDLAMDDARSKADYVGKQLGWESYAIRDIVLKGPSSSQGAFQNSGAFGHRAGGSKTLGHSQGGSQSTFIDSRITIVVEPIYEH